jgi:hypothetical protein
MMVTDMLKTLAKTLTLLALLTALAPRIEAAPLWSTEGAVAEMKTVRLPYSPLPSRLRQDSFVLQVRDVRQAGGGSGGCWNHCYNSYDECLGVSQKPICVAQIKTCMETCDRLSGLTNPTQRTAQPSR